MTSAPPPNGSPPTILAVDDDLGMLRLLEATLSLAGYRVLTADGGWSAIRAYENSAEPIHLLIELALDRHRKKKETRFTR